LQGLVFGIVDLARVDGCRPWGNFVIGSCHPFFIEVNGGRECLCIAAFNPKCLTKKTLLVIEATYNCLSMDIHLKWGLRIELAGDTK
jgi:hypothetical protein